VKEGSVHKVGTNWVRLFSNPLNNRLLKSPLPMEVRQFQIRWLESRLINHEYFILDLFL